MYAFCSPYIQFIVVLYFNIHISLHLECFERNQRKIMINDPVHDPICSSPLFDLQLDLDLDIVDPKTHCSIDIQEQRYQQFYLARFLKMIKYALHWQK